MSSLESNRQDAALDAMADKLYREGQALGYFHSCDTHAVSTGLCLRSKHGGVQCSPPEEPGLRSMSHVVSTLKVRVAMKMSCESVDLIVRWIM